MQLYVLTKKDFSIRLFYINLQISAQQLIWIKEQAKA